MYDVMGALCGCRAIKFDFCNNLLSSVHTILVIILQYIRLNIKTKILLLLLWFPDNSQIILSLALINVLIIFTVVTTLKYTLPSTNPCIRTKDRITVYVSVLVRAKPMTFCETLVGTTVALC